MCANARNPPPPPLKVSGWGRRGTCDNKARTVATQGQYYLWLKTWPGHGFSNICLSVEWSYIDWALQEWIQDSPKSTLNRTFLCGGTVGTEIHFRWSNTVCGSEMFISDPGSEVFHPGFRVQGQKDPGSWSASKNLSIITLKSFLCSRKYDPVP